MSCTQLKAARHGDEIAEARSSCNRLAQELPDVVASATGKEAILPPGRKPWVAPIQGNSFAASRDPLRQPDSAHERAMPGPAGQQIRWLLSNHFEPIHCQIEHASCQRRLDTISGRPLRAGPDNLGPAGSRALMPVSESGTGFRFRPTS